jgi:MYXO-CTERM domain-containing protein
MIPLLLLLGTPTAFAGNTVNGGLQAAIYEDGLDFGEDMLEDQVFQINKSEIGGQVSCYDYVGVRDFNLTVPIEHVSASFTNDGIHFAVEFATIYGQDMEIFGEDDDFFDLCVGFDKDLRYVQVENAYLEGTVRPTVTNGQLSVAFVDDPIIEGEITSDTSGFPDSLVLYFFEDNLWSMISEKSEDMLTRAVDAYWREGLLSGEFLDVQFSVDLEEMEVYDDALLTGTNLNAEWVLDPVCIPGIAEGGRDSQPAIDFGDGEGSSVGLGLTEGNLNRIFRDLYEQGYLCFPDDRMDLVYEMIDELFDPTVGGLQAEAALNVEPVVKMTKSGAKLMVNEFSMSISGEQDGSQVKLLEMTGDLSGKIDLGLDPVLTALTVSLHDLELDIATFSADHLVTNNPNAEDHLAAFIEGWLLRWLSDELEGISLFNTQFNAFGAIARADNIHWRKNYMLLLVSLYDENDPAVDRTPPETTIDNMELDNAQQSAVFGYSGKDDRSSELAFSTRVDGGTWSGWTVEQSLSLTDILPGTHSFEVKSKDAWLNEDPTPAEVSFEIQKPETEPEDRPGLANCDCATTSGGPAAFWTLLLAALLPFRRRKHAP